MFGPKKEELTGGWRKLYELQNFQRSQSTVMNDERNEIRYRNLGKKPNKSKLLGGPTYIREDNIKVVPV
jgi:small nuclear ribonucleoprotein (snRNP)-like protein